MEDIKTVQQEGWTGTFYFSTDPTPTPVRWAEIFSEYFQGINPPTNRNYYAAFVFTKGSRCYVICYGKAHFYLRPLCDYDFGVEVAKRIANESDIRQTASRRFQGRRKKDIRSFAYNTRLDVQSGGGRRLPRDIWQGRKIRCFCAADTGHFSVGHRQILGGA